MKRSTFLFPILLVLLSPTVLSESRFKLSMKCHDDDFEYVCDKLMTEFDRTAEIIESNLVLNADIKVELRFYELEGGRTLGGAFPILRKYVSPHDQVERLYPPALLKQLNADIDYEYAPDIVIDINSRRKKDFWFPGDGDIKRNQVDMSLIMLHEMMHGLGFISTWDLPSTHNDFITPMLNGHPIEDVDDPIAFEGFYETIFDAYIVHLEDHNDPKSAKRITDIAQSFNAFVPKGTKFDDGVEELFDTFEKSGHIENAKLMLKYATTRSDLAFMVPDSPDPPFTLYTSKRDFEIGGSINHFDENFKDTPDFLMTPSTGGGTLEAHIQRTGNNPGGGIGPKLRSILKTIGYTINENPAAPPQKRRFTRRNNQRKPLISL